MNEQFEEYKELLADEYRRNRQKGMGFHPARIAAKKAANAAYPDIAAAMTAAMRNDGGDPDTAQGRRMASSMSGFWKVLQHENGNGDMPLPAPVPVQPPPTNGNGNTRAEVAPRLLCMLEAIGIKAGDVWALGNLDGLTALKKCGDNSILNAVLTTPNGPIQRAGYRFEGLNAPRHDCKVKCVQAPRSEVEVRKANIEKRLSDWAARQERERDEMAAKHTRELAALRAELIGGK